MKKIFLGPALAVVVMTGACTPSEDPRFTQVVENCVKYVKDQGPMAVVVTGRDPEAYCRNYLKPGWEMAKLIEEQDKFEAQKKSRSR